MMANENKTNISRAFSKAAYWQIIITMLIAGISLVFGGVNAALSTLVGGGAVIVGAYTGMRFARRGNDGSAGMVLISLLKAEAIKVIVIAILLLVVFKYYRGLVPLSLIGGLAGSALASGAGLQSMNNEKNE